MTTISRSIATFGLLAAVIGCSAMKSVSSLPPVNSPSSAQATTSGSLPIAPRYQWDHNYGYCGEVSFISAGLYYGQYLSQYDARRAASSAPQNEPRSQLLLGVNDLQAARAMRLRAAQWNDPSSHATATFLHWMERNVALGYPVAIGVAMNQYKFYGNRNPQAGSAEYDHIVPVIAASANELTFSDNGLWGNGPHQARYLYTYPFKKFERTRRQANQPSAPIYSLIDDRRNFGVAILGVLDRDGETLPVRVSTDVNYEAPQIASGSTQRPKPERIVLTIAISALRPGRSYNLYRYDRLDAIPDHAFNADAAAAAQHWRIAGGPDGRFVMTQEIWSNEIAAYRTVPADAP
jgi:hypothetical protein